MTKSYELSFGKINILRADIAEIIINDGIEVDITQVDEADNFLKAHLNSPFSLLFNKINSYSYQFEAQVKMGTYSELNAIAILCYSEASQISTEVLISNIPRKVKWNVRVFLNKIDALKWLESEQKRSLGC